jgi:hypothetical protein
MIPTKQPLYSPSSSPTMTPTKIKRTVISLPIQQVRHFHFCIDVFSFSI